MRVRILILWALEVLAHPETKIGDPTNIEKDMAAATNTSNTEDDHRMSIDPPATVATGRGAAAGRAEPMPTIAPRPVPSVSSNQQRGEKAPPIFPIEGLSPYQNK